MTDTSIPLKQCSRKDRCVNPQGSWLPATPEYFGNNKGHNDGLQTQCRVCRAKIERDARSGATTRTKRVNPNIADGLRLCTKCGSVLPSTTEYFYERDGKLRGECKVCHGATSARYYKEHQVELNQYHVAWRARRRVHTRQYYAYWRVKNRDKYCAANREYYARHIESRRAASRLQASKRRTTSGSHTQDDISQIIRAQTTKRGKLHCWWCGKPIKGKWHVDHKFPVAKGGTDNPDNLCISCPHCNRSKSDKTPSEWAGRLL